MSNCQDGNFDTKYGVVHVRYPGAYEPYSNINTYRQTETRYVVLQGPALRAFKAAEQRITPRRLRRRGKTRHILITGSGYRSYEVQKMLYAREPGRFADPDCSLHCEALAIDVDQNQGAFRLKQIRRALEAEGWHYGVSGEPWHASYKLSG